MNTLIVLTVVVTLFASGLAQSKCISTSNCRCQIGANSFIDLNKITEKLSTSRTVEMEKFTFQLCQKFSDKNKCTGVFGCLVVAFEIYHSLGNSSQFVDPSTIEYKGNDRSAVIKLKCDPKAVTDNLAYKNNTNKIYNFVLTSKYACAETLTTPASNITTTTTKTTPKTTSTTASTTKTTQKTTSTTASTTKTTPKTTSTTASTTKTTPKTTSTTASTTKTTPSSNSTTTTTKATTKSSTTTPKTTSTTPKSSPKSASTTPKVSSTTATTKKGAASTVSTKTFGSILLAVILSWTLQ